MSSGPALKAHGMQVMQEYTHAQYHEGEYGNALYNLPGDQTLSLHTREFLPYVQVELTVSEHTYNSLTFNRRARTIRISNETSAWDIPLFYVGDSNDRRGFIIISFNIEDPHVLERVLRFFMEL